MQLDSINFRDNPMKKIKKIKFIIPCSLAMLGMSSPSNASLYEKLYRLTEKMYYSEYSLSAEQQKITDELLNQIEATISLPSDTTCGNKLELYKEAYKWAYSSEGLNATSSESEKFANLVTSKFCPTSYFMIFKSAYNFAYKADGMNKTRSDSKQVATLISDYEASTYYTKHSLDCYIENYNFAYSSGGMNKTRSESEKFATTQCLQ